MTTVSEEILPGQDILALLASSTIPEMQWENGGDDLCDCTFQRIGFWTNPYIARTLKVRMCCIWADIYKRYPQFVQEIPAFTDYRVSDHTYDPRPWEWNSVDSDMPRWLWHRQLAVEEGLPLATIRKMYEGQEPPKAVGK